MNLVQPVRLIDATGHISAQVMRDVAKAVDEQLKDEFYAIWGIKGEVAALSHAGELRAGEWPVYIVSETKDGSPGYHRTSHGQPYAEVAEGHGRAYHWSMVASHEILEMLVDPSGNRLFPGPRIELHGGNPRDTLEPVGYLLEICDPCEDPNFAYKKNNVMVSDFYTPDYFGEPRPGATYSYRGNIREPRSVCPGGYLTWWDPQAKALRQLDYTGKTMRMNYLPPNDGRMSLREQSDLHMRGSVMR